MPTARPGRSAPGVTIDGGAAAESSETSRGRRPYNYYRDGNNAVRGSPPDPRAVTPPPSRSGTPRDRAAEAEPSTRPLTAAVFHVLLALADGPCHGYAIMSSVRDNVEGGRRVGPGTIYGTLQRLEDAGLVQEIPGEGRRRSFELLPAGRAALEAEALRLTRLAELVRERHVLPEEG